MRNVILLIVVGLAAYILYTKGFHISGYVRHGERAGSETPGGAAPGTNTEAGEQTQTIPQQTLPARPVFQSKIPIPPATVVGEKHYAPPGVFYLLKRVPLVSKDGIHAAVPGDQVKLLKRIGNGTLKVTDGTVEFIVKETDVTNELERAREFEYQEHLIPRATLPAR